MPGINRSRIAGTPAFLAAVSARSYAEVSGAFFSSCSWARANVSSLTSAGTGTSIQSSRGRSWLALLRLGIPWRWRSGG